MLETLKSLVVKEGVMLGGLSGAERQLALGLVWAGLPDTLGNESSVNLALKAQLAGPAACLATDHVELRRWLVDLGWLARDGYGRQYQRVPRETLSAEARPVADAVSGLDTHRWVSEVRAAHFAQREARRESWRSRAPTGGLGAAKGHGSSLQ